MSQVVPVNNSIFFPFNTSAISLQKQQCVSLTSVGSGCRNENSKAEKAFCNYRLIGCDVV
jgi:hypothetical protein